MLTNTKDNHFLSFIYHTWETKTSVKIRATVIPSEGYDYFRPSQGAWNHITTYFI